MAGYIDAQIPMAAANFDPARAVGAGMDLAVKQVDSSNAVRDNMEQNRDRETLQNYDGDLYSVDGITKATQDLKHKVSMNTYGKLMQQAESLKVHDLDMKKKINDADLSTLQNMSAKNEAAYGLVTPALMTYQKDLAAGGKQTADANLEKSKGAIIQQLSGLKKTDGTPMFEPQMLQQMAGMDYKQLDGVASSTKKYHDMVGDRLKTAQTGYYDAGAGLKTEQAANVGKAKPTGKMLQLEADHANGDISDERYEALKDLWTREAESAIAKNKGAASASTARAGVDHQKVDAATQATRGAETRTILADEVKSTQAKLDAAKTPEEKTRYTDDLAAVKRELVKAGGGSDATGKDFLDTLPKERAALIKSIAEYAAPLTTAGNRKGEREKLLSEVRQYDPTYDSNQFSARAAVRKDFTSGPSARNVTAINTAIGHIGTLNELGDALKNGDVKILNKVFNKISDETGKPGVNTFDIAKGAVGDELMRVFRGVGASEGEAAAWRQRFDASRGPDQMKAAVATAADLLKSRVNALDDQWKRGMGTDKGYPNLLSEKSQKVLASFGGNEKLESGGSSPKPTAKDIEIGKRNPELAKMFKQHFGIDP